MEQLQELGYAKNLKPLNAEALDTIAESSNRFRKTLGDDYDYYDQDQEKDKGQDQGELDDDPNCPRDLYIEQMNMDFGDSPKKYDWEQIGRHFINYGRFTADMSDDLMRGLDYRFKQMKGR